MNKILMDFKKEITNSGREIVAPPPKNGWYMANLEIDTDTLAEKWEEKYLGEWINDK